MLKTMGVACLLVCALGVSAPAAGAATTTAQVRVVNTAGATLADQSQVTGDVTINTDPNADCFGPPGGSGAPVTVPGPSALGIVKDASESNGALRPLSVTDQFGFGLGVCGIGGFTFNQGDTAFWYLKVNHVGAQIGGDTYILHPGDEVLWYLSPGFPPPGELELVAPTVAQSGQPFGVRVFSYNDAGQRTPAAGALVSGAVQPTGLDGTTTVELGASATLQALRGADIASNREIVCVITKPKTCGSTPRNKIIGTNGPDRIRGSEVPDLIRSRAGGDFINARGGLGDKVNCGRGRDRAKVGANDVVRRCEKVIRP
jgi:hypothetical protein